MPVPAHTLSTLDCQLWSLSAMEDDSGGGFKLPEMTMSSFIGITVAVSGNVLISLALNLQKLAHRKQEAEKKRLADSRKQNGLKNGSGRSNEQDQHSADGEGSSSASPSGIERPTNWQAQETQPLIDDADGQRNYGSKTSKSNGHMESRSQPKRSFTSRTIPFPVFRSQSTINMPKISDRNSTDAVLPVVITTPGQIKESVRKHVGANGTEEICEEDGEQEEEGNESDYLKSKLWWTGFLLMNVGEIGNFISYAFAPASVVAPLGTFALIANCFFAPLLLHERFRKLDLFGIFVAVVGAVTVVLSANTSDTRFDPSGLVRAISQRPFVTYSIIYTVGAIILATLSQGPLGRRWVFVDVGLCALFGGFTVLSTKGVSTLLTTRGFEMFAEWITYPLIVVLAATGVGQIRYLNRALMRFDSKVVIPIQFVLFNLSAIIGSAILYGDFRRATFHQMVTFLYGCAATFAGVFLIAWVPHNGDTSPQTDSNQSIDDGESAEGILPTGTPGGGAQTGHARFDSISRQGRGMLVVPSRTQPILRNKASSVSFVGLSPGKGLLLVHSPPRDPAHAGDLERGLSAEYTYRRRTMSCVESEEGGQSRSEERRRATTLAVQGTGSPDADVAAARERANHAMLGSGS